MSLPSARSWERPHPAFLTLLIFLALFFYLPIVSVLLKGFFPEGGFDPSVFIKTVTSPYTLRILWFTFFQAILSTIFSLMLGLPGAYLLSMYRFPGRRLVRAASGVPFVLPPILVVLGFVIFFGNSGLLNSVLMRVFDLSEPPLRVLYSLKAIILAHGFYNFPIALRLIASLWQQLPPSQEWAAQTLGAPRRRLFFTIILPQLMPAILAASALIFMFCFTSFAIILVLGGGPQFTTVEVEIYRLAKTSFDIPAAGALSIIALVLTLGIMGIYVKLQKKMAFHQELASGPVRPRSYNRPSKTGFIGIAAYIAAMLLIVAGPLVAVVVRSLQKPVTRAGELRFTLEWYQQLLSSGAGQFGRIALPAIRNSVLIGIIAAAAAVVVGTALSYLTVRYRLKFGRLIDTLSMAPLAISSVILGLGYFLISRSIPDLGRARIFMIVAAHTVIAYPFVARTVSSVLNKIPPSQLQAAMLLGASPGKVFRTVELPVMLPALAAAAAFAFAISLGEINATLVFSSSTVTIPLAIYRMIGSYNFFGACALGTILVAVCALAFTLFDVSGNTEI
ncbi:MAG: iron ABC transporter permease [Spirochaetia bacterium]